MNSIYESRNDYLVIEKSNYWFCPIEGHYLFKNHLELCDANHTVWE
jgi:hypothetical protein